MKITRRQLKRVIQEELKRHVQLLREEEHSSRDRRQTRRAARRQRRQDRRGGDREEMDVAGAIEHQQQTAAAQDYLSGVLAPEVEIEPAAPARSVAEPGRLKSWTNYTRVSDDLHTSAVFEALRDIMSDPQYMSEVKALMEEISERYDGGRTLQSVLGIGVGLTPDEASDMAFQGARRMISTFVGSNSSVQHWETQCFRRGAGSELGMVDLTVSMPDGDIYITANRYDCYSPVTPMGPA